MILHLIPYFHKCTGFLGAKMVTFCIIHIGNRKIFFKHPPPPESQLILLHVSVFSYFTSYMWKASWDSGGLISQSPKCDVWASPIIRIRIFGVHSWKSFFQYNEIISTSTLPFHNPLVMKYYNVLAYFSLVYENCPFTKVDYFAHILYLSNTNKLNGHWLGV